MCGSHGVYHFQGTESFGAVSDFLQAQREVPVQRLLVPSGGHDIASLRSVVPKVEARWQAKERREMTVCARNPSVMKVTCRFLCDIGHENIGYTHGSGKVWEVFRAMAVC